MPVLRAPPRATTALGTIGKLLVATAVAGALVSSVVTVMLISSVTMPAVDCSLDYYQTPGARLPSSCTGAHHAVASGAHFHSVTLNLSPSQRARLGISDGESGCTRRARVPAKLAAVVVLLTAMTGPSCRSPAPLAAHSTVVLLTTSPLRSASTSA